MTSKGSISFSFLPNLQNLKIRAQGLQQRPWDLKFDTCSTCSYGRTKRCLNMSFTQFVRHLKLYSELSIIWKWFVLHDSWPSPINENGDNTYIALLPNPVGSTAKTSLPWHAILWMHSVCSSLRVMWTKLWRNSLSSLSSSDDGIHQLAGFF